MTTYAFNPFKKPIDKVSAEDLIVLKDVAEGWYLDYKRERIKIRDIAKHFSAFANQYGGFLFFGITEAKDGTRKAESFPGISQEEIELLSLHVREAAVTHVNPPIYYEEHLIKGPCENIELSEGKAILVLSIPQGKNPPYIHSSGRIYRRLADQSKPKEETDRHVLDELWRRGQKERKLYTKFLRKIPELPSPQAQNVWACIHIIPNDNYCGTKINELSFDEFRCLTIEAKENILGVSMPMQSVHATQRGFIAKQVENRNPAMANPTFRWWDFGAARFDLPINTYDIKNFSESNNLHKYSKDFAVETHNQGFKDIKICDFSILINGISSLMNTFLHLRNKINDKRPLYATYELRNVFYTLPFIDTENYIKRCSQNGIPVIQDKSIIHTQEPYFDNMIPLNIDIVENETVGYESVKPYIAAFPMVSEMLNSIGVFCNSDPKQIFKDSELWNKNQTE